MKKKPAIGLGQARLLCQMSQEKRLAFLAKGLPVILASAQGFWQASCRLKDMPREAEVLKGFSEEEAAKILILMDGVRCPRNLISSKMGEIVSWFYSHQARLIYANAVNWRPVTVADLREYVNSDRKSHFVDGFAGEYVFPNWSVYQRENRLYADIESYEDGNVGWNSPSCYTDNFPSLVPPVLKVAEAMSVVGIFTPQGLKVTSDIWGQITFKNTETFSSARNLTRILIEQLEKENLISRTATKEHVNTLFNDWQLPMYDFDFCQIPVTLEELKEEQERVLWAEIGDSY